MQKMTKVMRGTVWLIAAGLIAKVLGAVLRIPLTAMLGGAGMGYYSSAYGLFLPVFTLSVSGINTAAAALTAQYLAKGEGASAMRLRRLSLRLFAVLGGLSSIILFILAKPICTYLLHNTRAALSVQCFAPAILLCCLTAVLRGSLEGQQRMQPTAISQVAEGIARVVFGLGLTQYVLSHAEKVMRYFPADTELSQAAAAAAISGVTLSVLVGLLVMIVMPKRPFQDTAGEHHEDDHALLRALFRMLIPVAAASLVTNLTTLIDLCAGLPVLAAALGSEERANFWFGAYSGLAVTLFNLVPSVTNSFGKGVLPAFAESCTRGNKAEMQRHVGCSAADSVSGGALRHRAVSTR